MRFSSIARSPLGLFALLTLAACGETPAPVPAHVDAPRALEAPRPRDGIVVERIAGPPTDAIGDGMITLARFDLRLYRPVLLAAGAGDGRARTLPEWARQEHLVGGINAAMYEPDGRATSLLVVDGVEQSPDDARFGGFFAFDPIASSDAPFTITGRDCAGGDLAQLRARYRSIVANYRMLDCEGAPIAWVDEHRYSSAAFGMDREGRLVLIHSRTPYLMRDLARVLADPALGLTQIDYVEGGPEATLFVDDGTGAPLVAIGSYETAFHESDDVVEPWALPNILGLVAR
jgi:hypothetical protein